MGCKIKRMFQKDHIVRRRSSLFIEMRMKVV